jgi:hypothetical protein
MRSCSPLSYIRHIHPKNNSPVYLFQPSYLVLILLFWSCFRFCVERYCEQTTNKCLESLSSRGRARSQVSARDFLILKQTSTYSPTVQPHGNVYQIRLFLEVNIPNRYIFQKYRKVLSHTNCAVIYLYW